MQKNFISNLLQSAITRKCERLRSLVRVKLLASEVVHRNQLISRVIASIYSSKQSALA